MAEIRLPLAITYDTEGPTPISDVIVALQGVDAAIRDAVSLLPSLVDGIEIQSISINVRSITQESPLKELLIVGLIAAVQPDLMSTVPSMLEECFSVDIPDKYNSILTIVTMVVLFYGAAFAKDAATKAVEDGALRHMLNQLAEDIANRTGKSKDEILNILDAKYGSPGAVKKLIATIKNFFMPSQKSGSAAITFDRDRIEPEIIREIPFPDELDAKEDFERYRHFRGVDIEIHAQDRDRAKTGWACVPVGISDARVRMKIIEPLTSKDIWNKNKINGDITVISRMTSDGYVPSEIHLTSINDN
ncbi:UNVERIFIED_ORG: hypothetical protein ABID33_000221 [Xanthobacter viscosus]|uniref:Uncharacterized protein n=1 Tax=Xanthobacter autotrophicus TaxID=280 RepID=A0A6C1KWJ1_XANAU|nr:hypothetical protein [Xanthobacter autotrophicus]TLX43883.1 hypothetical protein FBQ73_07225 [Xanthobacter autotrophicus]